MAKQKEARGVPEGAAPDGMPPGHPVDPAPKAVGKKRGKPSLRNESGLGSEGQVVTERLRTKFLKNQATANDIVEDAVGIWTAGVSAGSLHEASVWVEVESLLC